MRECSTALDLDSKILGQVAMGKGRVALMLDLKEAHNKVLWEFGRSGLSNG